MKGDVITLGNGTNESDNRNSLNISFLLVTLSLTDSTLSPSLCSLRTYKVFKCCGQPGRARSGSRSQSEECEKRKDVLHGKQPRAAADM